MKKTLIALTALTLAGTAAAQSSVTLFGIVDTTLRHVSNSGGADVTQLASGGYAASRFGLRGVEDMGGGLSASFWLEAGMNTDNGTGLATNSNNTLAGAPAAPAGTQGFTFNRRSTVSLAGSWGEMRLGRDVQPQYWNLVYFDPFLNSGVGSSQAFNSILTGQVAVRTSNGIGYLLPSTLGGLYGQAVYYFGENASNSATPDDGNGYGIRLGYASGPFDVSIADGKTDYAAGDARQSNIGGSWNFGIAKVMGMVERDRLGAVRGRGEIIGVSVPVGPGEIRASYSRYRTSVGLQPRTSKWAVGYVHNLSKRTALYATVAAVSNTNGATANVMPGAGGAPAANAASRGVDVGLRHTF